MTQVLFLIVLGVLYLLFRLVKGKQPPLPSFNITNWFYELVRKDDGGAFYAFTLYYTSSVDLNEYSIEIECSCLSDLGFFNSIIKDYKLDSEKIKFRSWIDFRGFPFSDVNFKVRLFQTNADGKRKEIEINHWRPVNPTRIYKPEEVK